MTRRSLPKILFTGMGRAGKDTACEYLSQITLLRNAGTTSKYICKEVAKRQGLSEEEAYARRHESDEMRNIWYNIGNEVREKGPTTLIRQALEHGEISGGIRDYDEIIACRQEGLVDLIVWVENNRVPKDPTVKFTSKECDIVIENNWTLDEFHNRLSRLAKFANLPLKEDEVIVEVGKKRDFYKMYEERFGAKVNVSILPNTGGGCVGSRFCPTCNKNMSGTCLCFSTNCQICGSEYTKEKEYGV